MLLTRRFGRPGTRSDRLFWVPRCPDVDPDVTGWMWTHMDDVGRHFCAEFPLGMSSNTVERSVLEVSRAEKSLRASEPLITAGLPKSEECS